MSNISFFRREIRKYIYDQGWPSLRPIQETAIKFTQTTEDNFVIVARTASGKTEAAFLPAINQIDSWQGSVKIIYISPLKTLINDQFRRVNELCKYLSIKVTSWHGEANLSAKKRLLENPEGILLITPESIEAMLVEHPENAQILFKQVEWIIVDEIHSFMSNDRGSQLRSLFDRLRQYMSHDPRFIGLSATINSTDYILAKNFFGGNRETKILLNKKSNQIEYDVTFYPDNSIDEESKNVVRAPTQALIDLSELAKNESMLIFPNSKYWVEEIAVKLNDICRAAGINNQVFAHHANISKEMRGIAEEFALDSQGRLFTIVATSTLELGIDLGDVDSVVQYGPPSSVASLAQRLGRSGRRTGISRLHMIATTPWGLLQSIAALEIVLSGEVDSLEHTELPYDVLAHQVLAYLIENNGVKLSDLLIFKNNSASWSFISDDNFMLLLRYMKQENYLETYGDRVLVGYETEKFRYGFYAHFDTEGVYRVMSEGKSIGEVSFAQRLVEGESIYLAGQVWQVIGVEEKAQVVQVIPGQGGEAPIFPKSIGTTSDMLRQKMREILVKGTKLVKLGELEQSVLIELKKHLKIDGKVIQLQNGKYSGVCTFRGTKVNNTLLFMLDMKYPQDTHGVKDNETLLHSKDILQKLNELAQDIPTYDEMASYLFNQPELIERLVYKKYLTLLPRKLRTTYILENIFDVQGACDYLEDIRKEG